MSAHTLHTTPEQPTTINVGTVEQATELVFAAVLPNSSAASTDHRYILQPAGTREDYLSTMERFPQHQIKRTSEYYIDDPNGQWFACYNVDCFDPAMAIVRASSFEQAYEVFCDAWERWIKVEAPDASDYPEDDREYNNHGTHIDTNNVQIHELTLVSVSCEAADRRVRQLVVEHDRRIAAFSYRKEER